LDILTTTTKKGHNTMEKITLKDIINGQKTKTSKGYNTDLFKGDSENITEDFSRHNYDFITLISTDTDTKSGLIRETIIGLKDGEAYLLNTIPSVYNGEASVSIYSKWLTLTGFNYFSKSNDSFLDEEGHIIEEVKEFYDMILNNNNLEIKYNDIIELGELNSELNCITLSFKTENWSYYITINSSQQLSKITKKQNTTTLKHTNPILLKIKSILD
jgi:hypothetical protein